MCEAHHQHSVGQGYQYDPNGRHTAVKHNRPPGYSREGHLNYPQGDHVNHLMTILENFTQQQLELALAECKRLFGHIRQVD